MGRNDPGHAPGDAPELLLGSAGTPSAPHPRSMAPPLATLGTGVGLLLVALTDCTTYVRPVACGGEAFRCGDLSEVRFCESLAEAVEGADCAKVGLATSRRFCFVSRGPCAGTRYVLAGGDCEVVEYTRVREGATCSAGTPVFGAP